MNIETAFQKLDDFVDNECCGKKFNECFMELRTKLNPLADGIGITADELFIKWMNHRKQNRR